MAKMGRPKKEFDWDMIESLCRIHCTQKEIASVLKCDVDTLNNHSKEKFNLTFSEYYKRHCDEGKMSLRRMQWASAKKGNVTMQIWLGKQYIGQSDSPIAEDDDEFNYPEV